MTFGVEFAALKFQMLKSFTSNYCMQDNVAGLRAVMFRILRFLVAFFDFDLKNMLRDSMQTNIVMQQ